MIEAGGVIVGGHSVEDVEPKYGIAVTGIVDPRKLITNTGAKPGDTLILTKKLGTGIITNTHKARRGLARFTSLFTSNNGKPKISDAVYEEAIEGMKMLNRIAGELMAQAGAHACTDVTGFGLLGHAYNIAEASGVRLELSYDAVPKYDGIEPLAISGTKGGGERNWNWVADKVERHTDIGPYETAVLYDAQTSGPLLIAVEEEKARPLVETMRTKGITAASIIGKVLNGPPGTIRIIP
jgi:selenide,water dikinase